MTNDLVISGEGKEKLAGTETLQQIVEKFIISLNKDRIIRINQRERIKNSLKVASKRIPLETEREYHSNVISGLASDYLLSPFGNLPEIDQLLFSLKRDIKFSRDISGIRGREGSFEATIPLLARVKFGFKQIWEYKTESKPTSYSSVNYDTIFKAEAPPAPLIVREQIREAQRFFHKSILDCLETDVLNDIVQRDLLSGRIDLAFWQYWIPKNSDLQIAVKRIDKDPFVAAQVYDRHFLISQWDVESEEPYKHYLGEFTRD